MAVMAWFCRSYTLYQGKNIPRGIIIVFLVLSLFPVINVISIIVALVILIVNACDKEIKFKDKKFTKFLKG